MPCNPIVFQNIPRDRFQAIRARIRALADVSVTGDTGTAEGNGFKAHWSYDEANLTLEIQCLKKPRFMPERLVAEKIRALVTSL